MTNFNLFPLWEDSQATKSQEIFTSINTCLLNSIKTFLVSWKAIYSRPGENLVHSIIQSCPVRLYKTAEDLGKNCFGRPKLSLWSPFSPDKIFLKCVHKSVFTSEKLKNNFSIKSFINLPRNDEWWFLKSTKFSPYLLDRYSNSRNFSEVVGPSHSLLNK